jgi:hypothetical protein
VISYKVGFVMDSIKTFLKSIPHYDFKATKRVLAERLQSTSEKIKALFSSTKKDIEIFHFGGTKTTSFDPHDRERKLNNKGYFYEKIPIRTDNGEIHLYGKTLKKYADKWMKETKEGKTKDNFQQWIRKESNEPEIKSDIQRTSVRYFNDTDREQTEIHINHGKDLAQIGIDSKETEIKNIPKGAYIFVLGEIFNRKDKKIETKLFVAPKIKTKQGQIQHSSFLRAGNVRSAGMLILGENGQINILNRSGHYTPTEKEIAYIIKYLKDSGFDTSKIHIPDSKFKFIHKISAYYKINMTWGIVNQSADKWYEKTGKSLIDPS